MVPTPGSESDPGKPGDLPNLFETTRLPLPLRYFNSLFNKFAKRTPASATRWRASFLAAAL